MKKYLLFAATAAMMLASCSSEVDFTQQDLQQANAENAATPVQFGTYLGKAGTTRAGATGDINTTKLQASTHGFGVFAYFKDNGLKDCYNTTNAWNTSAPNFMYNTKVTHQASPDAWSYSPIKYWPNDFAGDGTTVDATQNATGSNTYGGKVSFFAYAPYVDASAYTSPTTIDGKSAFYASGSSSSSIGTGIVAMTSNEYTDEPEVKYVLSSSATEQVDLLWGMRQASSTYNLANGSTDAVSGTADIYNTNLTKQKVNETVDFYFKHALAKIGGNIAQSSTNGGTAAQSGVEIILDIDDGGVAPSSAITGGEKPAATLVTVKSINIRDIATYNGEGSGTTTATTYLANTGWFNIANGTWSSIDILGSTTGTKYSQSVDNDDTDTSSNLILNSAIAEPASAPTWSSDVWSMNGVLSTAATPVYSSDVDVPGIFLLPSTTASQSFVVTVEYIVRTYDSNLSAPATGEATCSKVTQKITNLVTIPANYLSVNTYYKLLIHLGLTSVKFSATVADWDEVNGTDSDGNSTVDEYEKNKEVWLPSNVL